MMEHSIEELERQAREANEAYSAALEAKVAAGTALAKAKLEATGLLGHIVEGPRWNGSTKLNRILVTRFGWTESLVAGPIIKKDGTPGERHGEVAVANAVDCGLPAATPATAA